jgi:hypothetical protein
MKKKQEQHIAIAIAVVMFWVMVVGSAVIRLAS